MEWWLIICLINKPGEEVNLPAYTTLLTGLLYQFFNKHR
jgi:hypothetical protein